MKRLLIILLACGFISSTNVFAEDQTVTIKVKINKLSQEQADQIPGKVNEIFKGSCHIDVDSKPVPQKGKTWKYNNMPYLFPEPVLVPYHHGDHGDHEASKPSRGNFPSPAPGPKPGPKPGPDKDGKCHHKDKHDGKCHGDKHGDKGTPGCSHGDKGHHGEGDHGKGHNGHGDHGKGDGHSNGGHHGDNCGGHGGHGGHGKGK